MWLTYEDVYDIVSKVGASIRSCGVKQVSDRVCTNSKVMFTVTIN